MTLVVAKKRADFVTLISDMQVMEDERALNPVDHAGGLKIILLRPQLCIAFAGAVEQALDVLRSIESSLGENYSIDKVVNGLLESHIGGSQRTDYIVASLNPAAICKIHNGLLEKNLESAWIGDASAFEAFQEFFHTPNQLPQPDFIPEPRRSNMELSSKMSSALRQIVHNAKYSTVGHYSLQIAGKSAFEYIPYTEGFNFEPVTNTTEEKSLTVPVDTTRGGYHYSVLAPKTPGVGVLGIYINQGELGLLFMPLQQDTVIKYTNISYADFLSKVEQDFGIRLDGMPWVAGGVTLNFNP